MLPYKLTIVRYPIIDASVSDEDEFFEAIGQIKEKWTGSGLTVKTKIREILFRGLTTNEVQKVRRNAKYILTVGAKITNKVVRDRKK